jgi:hypothetical protein
MEFCDMLNFYKKVDRLHSVSESSCENEKNQAQNKNILIKENIENILINQNYDEYLNAMENYELQSNRKQAENESMKEKITNLITKYKDSLQFPFNVLLEYANSVYKTMELEEQIEKQRKKIDEVKLIY